MWFIHIMEDYLAIKRNQVGLQATTRMNLKNRMLCKTADIRGRMLYDSIYT